MAHILDRSISPACLLLLLAGVGCAASAPRYTDPVAESGPEVPIVQAEDLAGELLVTPPEGVAEDLLRAHPDAVLPLAGVSAPPPAPAVPVTLPPPADTSRAFVAPPSRGPRKEYQVQVAITPSAEEAEEFKTRLESLLAGEEVFIVFTRPYYRIRVGRNEERTVADRLLTRLAQLGYENAMVIPVTIVVPPPSGDED